MKARPGLFNTMIKLPHDQVWQVSSHSSSTRSMANHWHALGFQLVREDVSIDDLASISQHTDV